ncbi:hypothetical protein ACH5RR_028776 [Cinchona calisaya]|uniref:Uncharacterized protein n=1 Tax=Cinchona calisaya TaxID=153742 RepID=A0ABD2YPR5_9GENT
MAAALDGGAFLSAFLQVMFDRIAALGAVLDDAENKETRNQAVKEWLEELHETVYEAAVYEDDDLLDQINTEAPRVKVETEYQSLSSTGQVSSTVFTAYDSDKFLEGIMPKIKNIVVRLDKFIKQIGQLGLRNGESKIKSYQTLSTSLVDETTLYGRDVDKYEIIQILLSEDSQVEYLGHIVIGEGVVANPSKVESMLNWPVPTSVKSLRGFLGLTGYYRRFVGQYGVIAKPFTELLKKEAFQYNEEAEETFQQLKHKMSTTPVLALPNFSQLFVLEINACHKGIEVVLMQLGRPLAFLSQALGPRNKELSIYEKELLSLITAVRKWRHYLLGNHLIIRTEHQSLKYLIEQRISIPFQQRWLTKLLGLDYEIQYKKGKENVVVDALSRRMEDMSCHKGKEGKEFTHSRCGQGIIKYKRKVYIGASTSLITRLIECIHGSPIGGYSDNDNENRRELEEIGKKIVSKCDGLPLAVKTVAGLLRSTRMVEEWKHILENDIWNQTNSDDILPALKLSYVHLSSCLKKCFAYCDVFHKDFMFTKDQIIQLWHANGLLEHRRNDTRIENKGEEYLHELRSRSLL